jgi:hypothetical protein
MVYDKPRDGAAVVSLPSPLDPDAGCTEMQAAIFLGVSARTLQAWRVRGGGPPYTKLGRAVRYQRRALTEFQRANTVASTTEADARRVRQ